MTSLARTDVAAFLADAREARKLNQPGRWRSALWKAFRADPLNPSIWHNMAIFCAERGGHDRFLVMLQALWDAGLGTPLMAYHIGLSLEALGDYRNALQAHISSARLQEATHGKGHDGAAPGYVAAGGCAFRLGMPTSAARYYASALRCRPRSGRLADPLAAFARSFVRMLNGDYARGFREYEARFRLPGWPLPDNLPPRWDGSSRGRVLVHSEQGHGDTAMFLRYLPMVHRLSGHAPVVLVSAPMGRYVSAAYPAAFTVVPNDERPACDYSVPMMSLPLVCGTRGPADIPPPIAPAVARVVSPGVAGLCWQGAAGHTNDKDRSCPPRLFSPLLRLAGWAPSSLQYGDSSSAVGLAPPQWADLYDMARQIATLDAVVTVDTAVAHVAGSLGVPTCVLVPTAPEWRWGRTGSLCAWYESVTVVRRRHTDDWPYAIQAACDWLRSRQSRRAA